MYTNDAICKAFQLLTSTVRDYHSSGRPCLGAALKPELHSRSGQTFNEQLLGFAKFGDFLRAAEAEGYVQLNSTPGGDIHVLPAGSGILESASRALPVTAAPMVHRVGVSPFSAHSAVPLRIRQDLWNAFNSFSADWVYDPAADIAFKRSNAPDGGETRGLIGIPAGRDRVIEWMRSFANMQDSVTKVQLSSNLEGSTAPFHFNNFVRSDPRLLRAWRRFHIQQVLSAIEAWAAANNVSPKDVTAPFYRSGFAVAAQAPTPPANPSIAGATAITPEPTASPLAGRLESLIDDLIDSLVRLRGLLQVVGIKHP